MTDAGSRHPGILLVLAVLAIAALAWLLLQPPDVVEQSATRTDDAIRGADEAPDPLGSAHLAGRGSAEGGETPALNPPPEAGDAPVPTHVVQGTVTKRAGGALQGVTVTARALRDYGWVDRKVPPAVVGSGNDGTYTLDISPFMAGEKPPTQVQVVFDHPQFVAERRKLLVGLARVAGPGAPLELHADAILDPAIVVVGVVRDPQAEPVAGIEMYLLLPNEKGFQLNEISEPISLDKQETAGDGTFQLRAPKPGRYYVAALSTRHVPAGRAIDVDWESKPDPVALALTAGYSITGWVSLGETPLVEVRVDAEERPLPEPQFNVGRHAVYLRDGHLHSAERWADTDKDGYFEIHGLDAGARYVSPSWIEDMGAWPKLLAGAARRVASGTRDARFDVAGVLVEVHPVSQGELIAKADVVVSREGGGEVLRRATKERGARFLLPPDTAFELAVKHPAFPPLARELRTGPLGVPMREVVDLGPPKPQGTLLVTLADEAGEPIQRADIRVVARNAEASFGFDMVEVQQSPEGVYRMENLEPGPHLLVIRPGRSSMEFFGHFLIVREPIHLTARNETRVAITAKRGGRLRISVRDEEGDLLDCAATLRDARGEARLVMYVTGGENFASMSQGGPGSASPSLVEPPLEPGAYELEVSAPGHETRRVTAKAEAGKTTDVEVTLRKL